MKRVDFRGMAEKLVSRIESLENEYVENFAAIQRKKLQKKEFLKELQKCEKIARILEQMDPDCALQLGFTLPSARFSNCSLRERKKVQRTHHSKMVLLAMKLLEQGKVRSCAPLPPK